MAEFLEERLSIDVRMGASYADDFAVEISEDAGGSEYRHLIHPYLRREFTVMYTKVTPDLWASVISLYHRVYGKYAGFRVRCEDDFSTNGDVLDPTAFDHVLQELTAYTTYQLLKEYGAGGAAISVGPPLRTIFKPVAGTVRVAIDALEQQEGKLWTVDTTTGIVSFAADKTRAITGISQAANAVVTVGSHTFAVGESLNFSGVVGMTEINGLRGAIIAVDTLNVTVAIDTTAFTAYTSGGNVHTQPQVGEVVKGGCQFDIPCRFNGRIDINAIEYGIRESGQIDILELLNP